MIPRTSTEWMTQIRLGERYRNSFNREKQWKENLDWFLGKYPKGIIPVNVVFGIARGMIPQIYFKAPTILNRPRPGNPQMYTARIQQAKVLDAADAYIVQQIGLKKTLKLCILDSFLYNIGVIKVGYHSVDSEFTNLEMDRESGEIMEALEELDMGGEQMPLESDKARKLRLKYSYHDMVKPNMPWALRWAPRDFILPAGTKTIEDAPWCAFRVVRRIDEVKAAPAYTPASKKEMRPNSKIMIYGESDIESPQQYRNSTMGQDDDYFEFFEIWDKRTGRIIAVADGLTKYMRNDEHGLPIGLPVSLIQFNQQGDDLWSISHVSAIAPQIAEYNETRTHEMMNRKACVLRLGVWRNALSSDEIRKIEDGNYSPVIIFNEPPQQSVSFFTPTMSRDIYKVAEDIFNDIRTVIGFSRNQNAEFESSRRTATEVKNVAQHNYLRDDELRDIVADTIADLFQNKIHPLIFQNWQEQRVFEVTSMSSQGTNWVQYDPEKIRGDYDVYVVPDSTLPLSKEQEKAEAVELFKALKGDPKIRQDALYRQTLGKFPQLQLDELIVPDQELQQMAAMEFQKQLILARAKTQPMDGSQTKALPNKSKSNGADRVSTS